MVGKGGGGVVMVYVVLCGRGCGVVEWWCLCVVLCDGVLL